MSAGHDDIFRVMDLMSGTLWAATYVLIIRRGLLDKTYGTPLTALVAAIAWEFIYAVVRPTPTLPSFVVPAWLSIDAFILYQYLRYGLSEERRSWPVTPAWFYARFAAALAAAVVLEHTIIVDLGDVDGAYSGHAVNVVMSLAFIAMLERRRDVRGQSMYIALGKLLGSAIMVPHAYALHGESRSLRAFIAVTAVSDVVYAVLLYRQCRAQGIRPWARL